MAAEGVEPGGTGEGEAADGDTGRPSVAPFMRGLRCDRYWKLTIAPIVHVVVQVCETTTVGAVGETHVWVFKNSQYVLRLC